MFILRFVMSQDGSSDIKFVEDVKRRWLATIDAMVDPMLFVGVNYDIIKCNKAAAEFSGVSIKDIIGRKCYEVFARSDKPCHNCKMLETAKEKSHRIFPLANIREEFFYEVSSQAYMTPAGELEGIIHVYRDRTQAKQLEKQLLQNEKLASIGLLAGGVAHEINNPLAGILIFSQMLLREMDKESSHYQDVIEIEAATQRCKAIVERLLDFARASPVQSEENLPLVSVRDAIKEALRFANVAISSQINDVKEKWLPESIQIKADKNQLIQLFLNLIQNAFHAMPSGGILTLEECFEGNYVCYKVKDTGSGIPKKMLSKIFDPFYTTKDPGEGTGLGLSICHTIAQDLHGDLLCDSIENKGTTFTLKIKAKHCVITGE